MRLKSPKQAPLSALVETVQQLGVITKEAPAEERLELAESVNYRQLMLEFVAKLPRDAGERTAWDQAWTLPMLQSLRDLRLPDAMDRKLYIRLGNTVVQGSARMELDVMLGALCEICKLDPKGRGPDDFAVWSVGRKLEVMCQSAAPGDIPISELVQLLHQFNNPAMRHRSSVHLAPAVVKQVEAGLPACTLKELPMLLLTYATHPELGPHLMERLAIAAGSPEGLKALSMNEAAVVANALAEQVAPSAVVSEALMKRIEQELEKGLSTQTADFVLRTAVATADCMPTDKKASWETLEKALQAVADLVFPAGGEVQVALPAERLAAMLRWQLILNERNNSDGPSWTEEVAQNLETLVGKLPLASLTALVQTLATSETPLPGALCQGIAEACENLARTLSTKDFVALALPLAQLGCLEPAFVETFDIEAAITTETSAPMLAHLLWALRAANVDTGVLWSLASMRLDVIKPSLSQLPDEDRALLYEALAGHRATFGELSGGAAPRICQDVQWKTCWQDLIEKNTPEPESKGLMEELLEELGYQPEKNVIFDDHLYVAPFVVRDRTSEIVVEPLGMIPRHPASREQRGSISIRHRTWMDQGKDVLSIPDRAWTAVAEKAKEENKEADVRKAQSDYLKLKLDTLFREFLLEELNPSEETAALLKDLPIGGPKGLPLDVLKAFEMQPPAVQRNVAETFKKASASGTIQNPAGWVMTAVQQQALRVKQKEELTKGKSKIVAAKPKPADGWEHQEGKPLSEAKPGLIVSGKVTNIVNNRVWVDVGFTSDGTFALRDASNFKVGDQVTSLKVHEVDLEKGNLQLRAQLRSQKKSEDGKVTRVLPKAKAKAAAEPPTSKAAAVAKARAKAMSQDWKTDFSAARRRPSDGWKHKDAKPLSEFTVGMAVKGTVTNTLHERVWVDIGTEKDASFWMEGNSFKIGDEIPDLKIDSIDEQRGRVLLKSPSS